MGKILLREMAETWHYVGLHVGLSQISSSFKLLRFTPEQKLLPSQKRDKSDNTGDE